MGKVLFAVIAAFASFILVESLICVNCKISLVGFCLSQSDETCATNTSVCFTTTATFFSASNGVVIHGCQDNSTGCNITTSGNFFGVVNYEIENRCCSSDRCNSAEAIKTTLTATLGAAVLATVWGSML
ncbi:uncharacterized protein KZ484_006292 [Pholidichthys leucotaenia]